MLTSLPAGNFEAGSIGSGVIYRGRNLKYSTFNITKNDKSEVSSPLYTETGQVDLKIGQLVFKVPQAKVNEVKKIHDSGVNVFYIIGTSKNITSVVYTGLFKIYDNKNNVTELNKESATLNKQMPYLAKRFKNYKDFSKIKTTAKQINT